MPKRSASANSDKQKFFDTIKQVRQLVAAHRGDYAKDVLGRNKTNTRMPYTHLTGRRQKLRARHATQKARAQQEAIQYDSSLQLLNSNLLNPQQNKDTFQKNSYKYEHAAGRIGKEKDGFLTLSKSDLQRIKGPSEHHGASSQSNKKAHGKKGKKIKKGKKKGHR